MTDEQLNAPDDIELDIEVEESVEDAPPQYGVGPFSIREVALVGVWIAAFVISFFPVTATLSGAFASVQVTWASVWLSGLSWVLTIGVPTAAVFLLVLRRLSPDGIRRVGSLSVDQFASVAFSVSAVVWLSWVWETVAIAIQTGGWVRSWIIWAELVLMLAGVVLTVLAPYIPVISEDFRHRAEIVAHRAARPIRPVSPRPAPEPKPAAAPDAGDFAAAPYAGEPSAADPYATGAYATGAYATGQFAPAESSAGESYAGAPSGEPAAAQADPFAAPAPYEASPVVAEPTSVVDVSETGGYGLAGDQAEWKPTHARGTFEAAEPAAPVRHQAFWALVPEERDIVDEVGIPVFRIGPTAWALVIEDRGDVFVVRHEDGRIGQLRDVSGVTRG